MKLLIHVLSFTLVDAILTVPTEASTRRPEVPKDIKERSEDLLARSFAPGLKRRTTHARTQAKAATDNETEEDNKAWTQEEVHFGDTACPCIGFDLIEGVIPVQVDGHEVLYPADLGSRCEKWEEDRHADCLKPDKPAWCSQAWCYVDPCHCQLPVLPLQSELTPQVRYRGRPIYYSYETCGGEDLWSKKRAEVGDPGCRCVAFDDIPGTTDVSWKDNDSDAMQIIEYPAEMGGSCQSWDKDVHPLCRGPGTPPEWCGKRWCYVDPCSCDIPTPPKVTMYFPRATFTGKSLYYSYETCGDKDTFTKELNLEACVNQMTQEKCLRLKVRNGVQK